MNNNAKEKWRNNINKDPQFFMSLPNYEIDAYHTSKSKSNRNRNDANKKRLEFMGPGNYSYAFRGRTNKSSKGVRFNSNTKMNNDTKYDNIITGLLKEGSFASKLFDALPESDKNFIEEYVNNYRGKYKINIPNFVNEYIASRPAKPKPEVKPKEGWRTNGRLRK